MPVLEITLPDELAQDVKRAGLLEPTRFEEILRSQLRKDASARIEAGWAAGRDDPEPEIPIEEIAADIRAMRAERRRAATR